MNAQLTMALAALLLLPPIALAAPAPKCVSAEEASRMLDHEVCVSAHVYDVVQVEDGTRYLDLCDPALPDDRCPLTIVSLWSDRKQAGELNSFLHRNVSIRGRVQAFYGRAGIFVNHVRQFRGEPAKFQPNPLLAKGFGADQFRPPIADPNLRSRGGRRSFMTPASQSARPTK